MKELLYQLYERESERKGREVNQRRVSGLLPCTGIGDIGVGKRAKRESEKKTGIGNRKGIPLLLWCGGQEKK